MNQQPPGGHYSHLRVMESSDWLLSMLFTVYVHFVLLLFTVYFDLLLFTVSCYCLPCALYCLLCPTSFNR